MEPNTCPHCKAVLSDSDVIRLHRRYAASKRETHAGGHNGGRPPKYPERQSPGQLLDAARRHSNAVLQVGPESERQVGPESERQIVPIEET